MLKKAKALGYSFAILISAVIILADLYVRVLAGKELTPLEGAKLVPQEALMAIYISTDSQAWTQLKKVGTSEAQNIVQQKINSWISKVAVLEGIDYQKSVQPWIGNVMLASLPADRTITNDSESWLMVVGIKNKFKAFELANVIEKQNTKKIQASQYNSVPIVIVTNQNNQTSVVAVLNQYLLLSSNKQTVEKAIDTIQSKSLASEASGIFPKKTSKNLIAQVYLPNYASWIESLSRSEANQIPSATLKPLAELESAVIEISIHDLEMRIQAIAKRRSLDKEAIAAQERIGDNLEKMDIATQNEDWGAGSSFIESTLVRLNQIGVMPSLFNQNRANAAVFQKFLFLSLGVSLAEDFQTQPHSRSQAVDTQFAPQTSYSSLAQKDHLNSLSSLPEAIALLESIQDIDVKTALNRSTSQLDLSIAFKPQSH